MKQRVMSQENKLLSDLVECRRHVMRELADEAEERADWKMAVGWRWMADRKRWPFFGNGVYKWWFHPTHTSMSDTSPEHHLPYQFRYYTPKTSKYLGKFLKKTAAMIGQHGTETFE